MRAIFLALLAAVCLLLQISLLPALRPLGVVPDLILVFVVLVGLEGRASTALAVGVIGGLAMDIASGANFGMWTAVMVLAALSTGMLHRAGIETRGNLVGAVIVIAGTALATITIWVGMAGFVAHWPVGPLGFKLATELVLNLILMVVMRPIVRLAVEGSRSVDALVR